jgi:hypothetical protein
MLGLLFTTILAAGELHPIYWGTLDASAGLDIAAIEVALKAAEPALASCSAARPDILGGALLALATAPGGGTSVQFRSDPGALEPIAGCITEAVAAQSFALGATPLLVPIGVGVAPPFSPSSSSMRGIGGLIGAKGTKLGAGEVHRSSPRPADTSPPAPVPRARLSATSTSGPVSARAVEEVVSPHLNQLGYCYQRVLREHPALAGSLTLEIRLLPSGQSADVQVSLDQLGDTTVASCVCGRLLRFTFPTAEAETHVTLAVDFSPR